MGALYFLEFKGERIELYSSNLIVATELDFIRLLERESRKRHLHLVSLKIQYLFGKFETKNHESHLWQDSLKTLLAHDFDVVRSTDRQRLKKSFYPIKFELRANGFSGLHFGHFHVQQGQSVALQFVKFCKATEYPPNIHKDIIVQTLTKYGGDFVAVQDGNEKLLLKLDIATEKILGDPIVFSYLSDPVADHSGQ